VRIPQRQLERALRQSLAGAWPGAWLIAGDEPLLVDESAAAVRVAATEAGYTERELHVVDRSFRWPALVESANNLSLFASRKIVEIRMTAPRPGDEGGKTLRALIESADPDRILIVAIGAKLDRDAARSVWVKSFEKHGVIVDVWPVDRGDLPAWIAARAKHAGLALSARGADVLAERVEGNLLAADQEIRKLALTVDGGEVGESEVLASVASSARFDVFRLTDALLAGDGRRAIRVLRSLRGEGVAAPLVSWALARELRVLTRLKLAQQRGERIDPVFGDERVAPRRQPPLKQAVGRYSAAQLSSLLALAARVDDTVKGVTDAEPWDALIALVIAILEPQRGWSLPAA
jgi:DNA polymerase III subunit delta